MIQKKDVQEALNQILAEMARPEAAERCLELWSYPNDEPKANYLFSRQFLGIGTTAVDSRLLANQARRWEERSQRQASARFGPTQCSNH